MSLVSRLAKNTFYQIVGKFVGVILGLVTIGLMTRYLGPEGFGHYTTIIAFLQFASVLIDFGLQLTTTQLLAKGEVAEEKIIKNVFTLRLFSAVIFLGLASALAWIFPYPLVVKEGIALASILFLFISLQSVIISIFQKNMAMAKVATAEIINRLVLLLGVWLVVVGQKNLFFIITAIVLGNFVSFLITLVYSQRYLRLGLAFDLLIWKKIWQATWQLAITIALTLVYFRADTIIMSIFRPQSEVGFYGAAYRVLDILVQFPYMFLGLILPLLTKFFVQDKKIFALIAQKTFDFLSLIIVPVILATLVLGEKIMIFVAGDDFWLSGQLLKILVLAAGAIYLGSFFGYIIVACELQKKMVKFYLANAVTALILYLIFIPLYSYWAAAIITVATEIFIALSAFGVLRKNIGLSLLTSSCKKSLTASLVMALILWLLGSQNLIVLIIIGLLVYFYLLYLLKGIDKKTVLEIIKLRG